MSKKKKSRVFASEDFNSMGENAYPWKKQDQESHANGSIFHEKHLQNNSNKNSNSDQNNSKGMTQFFIGKTLYSICMGKDRAAKEKKRQCHFSCFI